MKVPDRRELGRGLRRHGDVVLAVALSVLLLLQVTTDDYLTSPVWGEAVAGLVATSCVAWRRRAPLAAAVTASAALAAQLALIPTHHPPEVPFIAWVILVYTVAAYDSLGRALLGGATLVVLVSVWSRSDPAQQGNTVFMGLILGGFWATGRVARSRNRLARDLRHRTLELEAEREETARLAVAEERSRIARELHDVIAHTLSVIVVSAGAERMVQPAGSARDTLEGIEETSRSALAEMGRLLGMLRDDEADADLLPQPSLAALDALVEGVRRTGVDVTVDVLGSPQPIQTSMDVSAYRIVQEAITNSLKHGRPDRIQVRIHWASSLLTIAVADNGSTPSEDHTSGHGLVGLRERVALFHGSLVTGPSELGGFLLSASLPLEA